MLKYQIFDENFQLLGLTHEKYYIFCKNLEIVFAPFEVESHFALEEVRHFVIWS